MHSAKVVPFVTLYVNLTCFKICINSFTLKSISSSENPFLRLQRTLNYKSYVFIENHPYAQIIFNIFNQFQ